jgi:hypothetical protein
VANAPPQLADGVRVTATSKKLGATVYGLWVNWEACLAGYPQVKPLFHVCGDASFVRLKPVCAVGVWAFVQRTGLTGGALSAVKTAQRLNVGHTVFETGTPLSEVRDTVCG